MDLDGELPELREQFGSRAEGNDAATSSYACDHVGVRRLTKAKATKLGLLRKVIKFVKVYLYTAHA